MSSQVGYDIGDPMRVMIRGIGSRYRGSPSKIPGSICNGFSASKQFQIAPITAENDKPDFFDGEGYIAHSLPYLAGLARLEADRNRNKHTEPGTEGDSLKPAP